MGIETLAIAGLAVSVIGAGVAAYGSYQQGKTQNTIAQFNAAQRAQQAKMQMMAMEVQNAQLRQQSQANFQIRNYEAQVREANADAIEQRALTGDKVNRVEIRERRKEFARMQGSQRAMIAASGVAESTGTPLDLLAESAAIIQQDVERMSWKNEAERRTLFAEADNERLGGQLALAGATLDRDSSLAEAALRDVAARSEYMAGMAESRITRLTGAAAQRAGSYQAAATLFSGIGSAAGSASSFYQRS